MAKPQHFVLAWALLTVAACSNAPRAMVESVLASSEMEVDQSTGTTSSTKVSVEDPNLLSEEFDRDRLSLDTDPAEVSDQPSDIDRSVVLGEEEDGLTNHRDLKELRESRTLAQAPREDGYADREAAVGQPAEESEKNHSPHAFGANAISTGSEGDASESDPEALRTPREPWNNDYVVYGDPYRVLGSSLGYLEVGIASWYGKKFHGRKTSNGERFDMYQVSAAHKTLPIPTVVRVTNLDNGRKIDVRVNDRGPFHDDRIIDLSMAAARVLGFSEKGTAPVVVEALDAVNYPDQFPEVAAEPSVYLQAGAFRSVESALELVQQIGQALPPEYAEVGLRELASEETESVLHKVWIGPIEDSQLEQMVSEVLQNLGIKKPMRVLVD